MTETPSTRTTSADGTSISYQDLPGDGPGIVVLHGITESRKSMQPLTDRLHGDGKRVVAMDLRGHGESGDAENYDLASMGADVAAVVSAAGLERPHLVGHSLGGIVVSAAAAQLPVRSVTNIDQALQLGAFKEMLSPVEQMLRDPTTFTTVMTGVFDDMSGAMLSDTDRQRLTELRNPKQDVVLGVWDIIFSQSAEDINATVEAALAGYRDKPVPYLSLFGIDPGDGYGDWLATQIPGAVTEVWAEHGHYPHLVDLDRFVDRLEQFHAEADATS